MTIEQSIDLTRYPLHDMTSDAYKALIANCRHQLKESDCCLLPDFITPEAIRSANAEAVRLGESAYQINHHFAYDDVDDETLERDIDGVPEDHPLRFKSLTKIRFVARDVISKTNPIQTIHTWPNMCQFLEDVLELPKVYTNDCPLSACVFTVAEEGELQDWHFDGTDYVVTLMLEKADQGGDFEFVSGLRKPGEEDDFESITKVIKGTYPNVTRPNINPGTLTLFKGRRSLHRASPVKGDGRRVMGILSYETEPGRTGSSEFLKLFYDRAE